MRTERQRPTHFKQTKTERDRETDKQRKRQTDRDRETETETERQTETDRQTDRDRQTNRRSHADTILSKNLPHSTYPTSTPTVDSLSKQRQ